MYIYHENCNQKQFPLHMARNHQITRPKIPPKSEATAKGHIRKSFKGKQSTQPREPSGTPSKNPTRTHIVYLQATDLAGKIYTDQTGRLPVTSSRSYKYIMVAYDYDSNTIHAEPMKNCSDQELLK